MQIKGILHVGAHICEELVAYEKVVPRDCIVWVEAIPSAVQYCIDTYPHLLIESAIVSDVEEEVVFHVANNYQSSSIFEFGLHTSFYPQIKYVESVICKTQRLDDIIDNKYSHMSMNFLNIDIQGAELKALKGMQKHLPKFDYLYLEVNRGEVYKGVPLIGDITDFLSAFGFVLKEVSWTSHLWGDAFFMKEKANVEAESSIA